MSTELKGICPIIATPFTKTGLVDDESLEREVSCMADNGCHGVTLFGIAGEYYKLSDEESARMVRVVVDTCKKKGIPSIISVTQHATELAVHRAKFYQDCGADSLMLLPPFFLKPGAGAIYEHMKAVCSAVDIPVVVQYAPEQTGVAIAPEIMANLQNDVSTELYYKIECKPAGGYISNLLRITDNGVKVFIGNAGYQFIDCFDRGAIGAMPGGSMFDLYLKIYDLYLSGDRAAAMELHGSVLLPFLNHIRQNVEMIIAYEKRIMMRRGMIATDYCRHPGFTTDPVFDSIFDEFYEKTLPYLKGLSYA